MENLPCVELSNGMQLTLRERRMMVNIIDEAVDRHIIFSATGNKRTINQELASVYALLGDYIAAFQSGNINRRDFERCG